MDTRQDRTTSEAHDAHADAAAVNAVRDTQGEPLAANASDMDSTIRGTTEFSCGFGTFRGGRPLDPRAPDPCHGRTVTVCVDPMEFEAKPEGGAVAAVSQRIADPRNRIERTLPELAQMISKGRTVMPGVCEGGRTASDWRQQELFFVDVDNDGEATITMRDAVKRAYDRRLPLVMSYPTFNTSESREKFRLVFAAPGPITDPDAATDYLATLLAHYPEGDPHCKDLSRMFYGTNGDVFVWSALTTARELRPPEGADAAEARPEDERRGPYRLPDAINEGERNSALFKHACQLREQGLGDDELRAAVMSANAARCKPPLDRNEVDKICRSACRYQQGRWRGPVLISDIEDAMGRDADLAQSVAFNELRGKTVVRGPLPWDPANDGERLWTDTDGAHYMSFLQDEFGRDVTTSNADNALKTFASKRHFNPLTDELERLAARHDGGHYAHRIPYSLLGCQRGDRYSEQVWWAFMRAAVLRAFEPGSTVQWMPVLYGPQGCGKSYVSRLMSLRDEWFCDSVTDIGDIKTLVEATSGRWICELPELAGLSHREMEKAKAAITRTEDTCREAYGRFSNAHPRRFVFIGTTNDHSFLHDETGERRFYPIECAMERPFIDVAGSTEEARDLIRRAYGEVTAEFLEARRRAGNDMGELRRLFFPDPPADVRALAEERREAFKVADPIREAIEEYLEKNRGKRICVRQVAIEALGMEEKDIYTNRHANASYRNIQSVLDSMPEYHSIGKQRTKYGSVKCWSPDTA